jgi:MHS family proline/betaine transporter-like MFS transporter
MKLRDKVVSGFGSALEWYDFSLYGYFAPLLAQLYFPESNPAIGLLKTFSIFSIGFFARPIGALIFGYISDKYGRTSSLKLTPLLITCPTLLFCFLPTYEQIGIFAPLLLTFLRIWQGICIGGEHANNIVYLCETSKKSRLYFIGSIGSCTGSLGILFSSLIAALCYSVFSPATMSLFGWRLAFSISFIIGIVVFLARRTMKESDVFSSLPPQISKHNPIYDSYKNQWQDYLLSIGLILLPATSFYYIFIFLPTFLTNTLNYTSSKILGDNSFSLLMRLFIIPIIGLLADKVGGIVIARLSCLLFIFLSVPLFYNIVYFPELSIISIYTFALLTTLNAATTPGLLMEYLKPETRCTIFSFSFNLCFGIFGGVTPVIGFLLADKIESRIAPVYYLVMIACITFIVSFFYNKRSKQS